MKDGELIFDGTPYKLFIENRNLVENSNIDLPDCFRIIDLIEEKTNLSLDKNIKGLNDLCEVLLDA